MAHPLFTVFHLVQILHSCWISSHLSISLSPQSYPFISLSQQMMDKLHCMSDELCPFIWPVPRVSDGNLSSLSLMNYLDVVYKFPHRCWMCGSSLPLNCALSWPSLPYLLCWRHIWPDLSPNLSFLWGVLLADICGRNMVLLNGASTCPMQVLISTS